MRLLKFLNEGATDYILSKIPISTNLQKLWDDTQKKELERYGDGGYTGSSVEMGKKIDNKYYAKVFNNAKEAEKFILDTHDKWDGPLVVKYKEGKKEFFMMGGWSST